MCGIAGIVSKSGAPVSPHSVKAMCDIMAHRGPDDAGYAFFRPGARSGGNGGYYSRFTDPEFHTRNQHLAPFGGRFFDDELQKKAYLVGMGHRRLAIIDLSVAGHQPMPTSDRRYWLSFNGEIYNFPALKERLRSKGHNFFGNSDTEVILRMWEQHGPSCLEQLDGMFAIALYDLRENTLTLARDRFGVKPLYYCETPDSFAYASEVKGILPSGCATQEIDEAALYEYMTFQNIFSDRTLLKNVRLLEPGMAVTLCPGSREPARFWSFYSGFPTCDAALREDAHLADVIAEHFAKAVKRQLISDVEVGAYLSGGMDSGSIVAVAGQTIPRLHTFTCGFDLTNVSGIEQGFDERANSERLAYLLQTEHYEVVLHSGDMPAAMEKLSWHVDDPRVGMCHQNWYAAKLASRFVKVCLSGTGGDELFAGYPWRYVANIQTRSLAESEEKSFAYWHRLLGRDRLGRFLSNDFAHLEGHTREAFSKVYAKAPAADPDLGAAENTLQRMLAFEFRSFLHGLLLVEDKISMAHGMEVRVPFLDNALVDLAFRIPISRKLDIQRIACVESGQHFNADEGKIILRQAMRHFLPESYIRQPKQGFSPPDGNWYRGESMDYIKDILFDAKTRQRPWFDQKEVESCLSEHFQGQHNHRLLIWSLLSVEWFQRHFCDGSAARAYGQQAGYDA